MENNLRYFLLILTHNEIFFPSINFLYIFQGILNFAINDGYFGEATFVKLVVTYTIVVIEIERSCSRLSENSIVTLFLFVSNVHSCCVRLRCVFVIYLFHTHDLCSCSFSLLFSFEMILDRFHLLNTVIS